MFTEYPHPDSMTVYVDPYPGRKGSERVYFDCDRCNGTGSVSWGMNVDGAVYDSATGEERTVSRVCFKCDGTGRDSHLVSSARAAARRRVAAMKQALADAQARIARQEAESAALAAAVEEARARYTAEHPEVVEALQALRPGSFAESIRTFFAANGHLSEAQAAAVLRMAAEQANEPAPAPVVEGRVQITGTVRSTKWVDNAYGGSRKMLVVDDRGFKVWGTVPSALSVERGDRVSFTATVTASDDDETFGFYSRPTKAARA